MNLIMWIVLIFLAHAALYLFLGTPHWLATTLLATAVWAAVLVLFRTFFGQRKKEGAN
ncbi:hypothetical protein [Aneurinibacillus tyrosinisolvens]|uniref:hypothetical protein n=1 Tax=Aneurinibacillus tyrosinisolvens TaxID=1443435 RepID=UPI000A5302AE|nr:hypothetical protein [Aneurinibacillus tyrosinisolvens]